MGSARGFVVLVSAFHGAERAMMRALLITTPAPTDRSTFSVKLGILVLIEQQQL